MDLSEIGGYVEALLGTWLAVLVLIVLFRMWNGQILLTGLLRVEKHAPFGLDRIQLLFVTLLFSGGYLIASLAQAPHEGLPRIPTPILLVLIGSNGAYLAVKWAALIGGAGREDK